MIEKTLKQLGINKINPAISTGQKWIDVAKASTIESKSPIDGKTIAKVKLAEVQEYREVVTTANKAFKEWRLLPAPQRGEIVRQIGDAFRQYKEPLGQLVSYEMGKLLQEGLGEVQEIIDICDFSVGLSRQLYGLTMPSERVGHRLQEVWQPLGIVGIISAFNFPVAVWAWNAMIAAVCGNVSIWKPSEKTPLCAIACMNIIAEVLKKNKLPEGIFNLVVSDTHIGKAMAFDTHISLLSATGSTVMGKAVAEAVAKRLGKYLLELGGNNAIIISQHADTKLAIQATLFAAVGTAGQRCTTARRLFVHKDIYNEVKNKLLAAYKQISSKVGNPLKAGNLIGPLIDSAAVATMQERINLVKIEGGKVLAGGEILKGTGYESETYVTPALIEVSPSVISTKIETFAPILYLLKYNTIDEAIAYQNDVPQGLSSSLFSNNIRETELFLSAAGSDCGIANINVGPSGAEIGGAFGGEKETGGGRESGSDSWKAYMRRQTITLNYSDKLPLAQGIKFDI